MEWIYRCLSWQQSEQTPKHKSNCNNSKWGLVNAAKMKRNKAAGPDGIIIQMLKAVDDLGDW